MEFMEDLRVGMSRSDEDKDLNVLMKYHEGLSHPPLRAMHSLEEEGKTPKFILNIKSTPPCPS